MQRQGVAKQVWPLAESVVHEQGFTLWDVEFLKEGAAHFLRITIDSDTKPVTVEDCEQVSRAVSDDLDAMDPIRESYYLEVSSAGLGRRLKRPEHFEAFLGEQVSLKLIRPRDGRRAYAGILEKFEKDQIVLQTDEAQETFLLADCSYVKVDDDLDLFD